MRTRYSVAAIAVVAGLAACTGGAKTRADIGLQSPASSRTTSAACARLQHTAEEITRAQSALYSRRDPQAVTTLTAELETLRVGAPDEVKAALADVIAAFHTAEALLRKPSEQNKAEIRSLATKLSADGQQISAYATAQCPSG